VTVTGLTAADPSTSKVNAVSFSITAPPVNTSVARVDGVSDGFQSRVQAVLAKAAKNPFSTTNTAANLEQAVEQFYGDQGYAAAKIEVTRSGDPRLDSGAIVVPFAIQVQEGQVYTVKSIQLPPGAPVTQAEIDKILSSPSPQPQGVKVRSVWALLASRYHNKGYLDCKVTPHATLNDADGTVSYTAAVDPSVVYHLAFVKFDNVSDELRTLLIHNWEMMPGDVFDESYVSNFVVKVQQQDPILRRSLAGVKVKFDAMANPNTHEVNVVIRLEK
jgi:outer membrane protein insertion porin family